MKRPVVLVLGPSLQAVSGVTTHVQSLLDSRLAADYSLVHFQVGSEGRRESPLVRLARLVSSPFLLAVAICRHGADIVHINVSWNAKAYWRDLAHLIAAKLCGARVVFQKHGGYLEQFAANPAFAAFVRWTLRLPDAVVVLAQAELDAYRAFLPGQNVAAVPNGIDPEPYLAYRRPPLDPGAPLKLLYMGRLASTKGVIETLESLAMLRAQGVTPAFVIAGSGADEALLREQVRRLDLAGQVHFAGAVWGEAKRKLLSEADVLMLPSYHAEGLPYALLEGMAAGLVPVVTAIGAIPDVVSDGVHGCVVPPRDAEAIAKALSRLHAERVEMARMSRACRERIAHAYSLERLSTDFIRLYSQVAPWPALRAG